MDFKALEQLKEGQSNEPESDISHFIAEFDEAQEIELVELLQGQKIALGNLHID